MYVIVYSITTTFNLSAFILLYVSFSSVRVSIHKYVCLSIDNGLFIILYNENLCFNNNNI